MSTVPPVVVIGSTDGHVRRSLSAELRQSGYIVIACTEGLAASLHITL